MFPQYRRGTGGIPRAGQLAGQHARMHISAKADYATRALLELAREPARPLTCEAITSSQQIPFRFVDYPSLKRRAQEFAETLVGLQQQRPTH
jgi:hypothetical protein